MFIFVLSMVSLLSMVTCYPSCRTPFGTGVRNVRPLWRLQAHVLCTPSFQLHLSKYRPKKE